MSAKYSSPVEFGAGGDHTMMTVEDAKKISEMLKRSGRPSYGRVRGIVYRLMIEPGHRSIGLYDDVTGEKVGVAFTEELDDAVKQLRIGAHVSIKGFKRTHEGKIIGKVRAEEIRQLPPRRHAMVSAADLAESIKGFKRTHEGKIIGKVRAEEIRQLPPRRHAMVSAADLADIAGFDFTFGLGSVAYVNELREAMRPHIEGAST